MFDNMTPSKFGNFIGRSWRVWFGFIVPIALLPLLLDYDDKMRLCAYVLFLMILYWMFEPINIYMTALFPVALFPLLGIATSDEVSVNYMKSTNMIFLAGLMMGLALEYSNLHQRIALKVVIMFGSSIKTLMCGVMFVTGFLSMWINNTATTAMMIPIVDSILTEINNLNCSIEKSIAVSVDDKKNMELQPQNVDDEEVNNNIVVSTNDNPQNNHEMKNLRKALLLSIAYSANIGGISTLTGTGTNLVLQDVFGKNFPNSTSISFTSWFIYAFPASLVTIIVAWLFLSFFFIRKHKESPETGKLIRSSARRHYENLGPYSFHEIAVTIHFVALILLWFLREPMIFPGWADLITDDKNQIKDATPAILIAISMFLFPANFNQFFSKEPRKSIDRLLSWKVIQTQMSWGVVLLLGGGFALADGTERSGLSHWFSGKLSEVNLSPIATTIILVIISATVTEMASNVATANVILPVLAQLAVHMHVNPLLYMIPVTISISFAFMFPVSTPPNAIVFEYLKINIIEMVTPGIIMNILAISIQLVFINTWGVYMFDLHSYPDWANKTIEISFSKKPI